MKGKVIRRVKRQVVVDKYGNSYSSKTKLEKANGDTFKTGKGVSFGRNVHTPIANVLDLLATASQMQNAPINLAGESPLLLRNQTCHSDSNSNSPAVDGTEKDKKKVAVLFSAEAAWVENNVCYYKCECKQCGLKDILTAWQAKKHAKACKIPKDNVLFSNSEC